MNEYPKKVTCRVTIRYYKAPEPFVKKHEKRGFTLLKYNTYGIMTDARTLKIAEGYTFHAGRVAGFGKTHHETVRLNGDYYGAKIDHIEPYEEEDE